MRLLATIPTGARVTTPRARVLWVTFWLTSGVVSEVAAQSYAITDLGTLGGSGSKATAINEVGQIVGTSALNGDWVSHAFLYQAGQMIDLGPLGGLNSEAHDINDLGQVVGLSGTFPSGSGAFLYSDGVMTDLGISGHPYAINNTGEVAGSCGARRTTPSSTPTDKW